jgi:hypothetical protein
MDKLVKDSDSMCEDVLTIHAEGSPAAQRMMTLPP